MKPGLSSGEWFTFIGSTKERFRSVLIGVKARICYRSAEFSIFVNSVLSEKYCWRTCSNSSFICVGRFSNGSVIIISKSLLEEKDCSIMFVELVTLVTF